MLMGKSIRLFHGIRLYRGTPPYPWGKESRQEEKVLLHGYTPMSMGKRLSVYGQDGNPTVCFFCFLKISQKESGCLFSLTFLPMSVLAVDDRSCPSSPGSAHALSAVPAREVAHQLREVDSLEIVLPDFKQP